MDLYQSINYSYDPSKDPFYYFAGKKINLYDFTMNWIFQTPPAVESPTLTLLRFTWKHFPKYFKLQNGLHQNSDTDRLHFSVALHLDGDWSNLHIYGYLLNARFLVTEITMGRKNTIISVCKYTTSVSDTESEKSY